MKFKSVIAIALGLILTACNGVPTEKTVKVSGVKVNGQGGEYMKVIDGDYTLTTKNIMISIPVKLELTKKIPIEYPEMLNIELLTTVKSGSAFKGDGSRFVPEYGQITKLREFLSGKVGDVIVLNFKWSSLNKGKQSKFMSEVEGFEVKSTDISIQYEHDPIEIAKAEARAKNYEDNKPKKAKEAKEAKETKSSGSAKYDKMLDDYEEYVDQYIVLYKKAMKGDSSAMTEYPALMQKATKFQNSMISAQQSNNLSVKQITRMSAIQMKMANGIL